MSQKRADGPEKAMFKRACAGNDGETVLPEGRDLSPNTTAAELADWFDLQLGELNCIAGKRGDDAWVTLWRAGDDNDPWDIVANTLHDYDTHDLRGIRDGIARRGAIIWDSF